jgi:hypothetical protein
LTGHAEEEFFHTEVAKIAKTGTSIHPLAERCPRWTIEALDPASRYEEFHTEVAKIAKTGTSIHPLVGRFGLNGRSKRLTGHAEEEFFHTEVTKIAKAGLQFTG